MCSLEEVEEIAHRANSIPISCSLKLNMDGLLERIWDMMALVSLAWPPDSSSSTQAPLHPLYPYTGYCICHDIYLQAQHSVGEADVLGCQLQFERQDVTKVAADEDLQCAGQPVSRMSNGRSTA